MNELLSIAEIYSHFPSEWVLVEDPKVNEHLGVTRGRVVCHSKDRDEVYRRAIELRLQRSAFLYTGDPPADMEYILTGQS